jgi:hypothetical protein
MIIVAGIARSGLTVTMQMLNAGGFPCFGEYPAFEDYPILQVPWHECKGKAIKLVDSQLYPEPEGDYRIIRLHRDIKEQAKSQKKFMEAMFGTSFGIKTNIIEKSLVKDYTQIDEWTKKHRTLHLNFERIINTPLKAALDINEFLGADLNLGKMSEVVRKRSPRCYPTLLELEL